MKVMKEYFTLVLRTPALLMLTTLAALPQQLPEGPGRAELEKSCSQCHELARSISLRQDRDGWNTTIAKMSAFGMKADDHDIALVIDYLVKNFPAEDVPKINVNTATAIELEAGLSLKRSQSAALLAYRAEHGNFKSLEDLKKVPLIDAEKIEAKKSRIAF
jgi:competence protein ComEA